ncbi:hypothetical protein [Serratia symbiotica]|nr:hypothetical protein [Serratia symbiotica]
MNKFSKLLASALLAGTAFSAATAYVQAAPAPIQCQDDEIAVNLSGKWVCVKIK